MAEVGWVVLGVAIQILVDVIKEVVISNAKLKTVIKGITTKLEILKPLIEEVKNLNKQLNVESENESGYYETYFRDAAEHIRKCGNVGRIATIIPGYFEKLQQLDQTLQLFILFVYATRDSKKMLILTSQIFGMIQGGTATVVQPHDQVVSNSTVLNSPHALPPNPQLPPTCSASTSNSPHVGQRWIVLIRDALGPLLHAINESEDTSRMLGTALNKLKTKVQSLQRLLNEIERLNMKLDLPDCFTEYYRSTINKGTEEVRERSQVHGFKSLCKSLSYRDMVKKLNKDLEDFVQKLLNHTRTDMEKKFTSVRESMTNYNGDGGYYQIPTARRRRG